MYTSQVWGSALHLHTLAREMLSHSLQIKLFYYTNVEIRSIHGHQVVSRFMHYHPIKFSGKSCKN